MNKTFINAYEETLSLFDTIGGSYGATRKHLVQLARLEKELIKDIERAAADDDLEYVDMLIDAKGFIEEALHIANQDNQKFHFKNLVIPTF